MTVKDLRIIANYGPSTTNVMFEQLFIQKCFFQFNLPMNCPIPGSELTREPFRWDQRLFSLVLRLAGTPAVERDTGLVPSDSSPIDAMCEVTGGK